MSLLLLLLLVVVVVVAAAVVAVVAVHAGALASRTGKPVTIDSHILLSRSWLLLMLSPPPHRQAGQYCCLIMRFFSLTFAVHARAPACRIGKPVIRAAHDGAQDESLKRDSARSNKQSGCAACPTWRHHCTPCSCNGCVRYGVGAHGLATYAATARDRLCTPSLTPSRDIQPPPDVAHCCNRGVCG